jgi:hypothetical protein
MIVGVARYAVACGLVFVMQGSCVASDGHFTLYIQRAGPQKSKERPFIRPDIRL